MHRSFLITAALLAAFSVILGAFGAHGLKQVLPPESLNTFETGVRYHFYHSLALLATGILFERFKSKWTLCAGYFFIAGIILFSGSLYALAFLKAAHMAGLNGVGIITPFGGLFFIAGWFSLAVAFSNKSNNALRSV